MSPLRTSQHIFLFSPSTSTTKESPTWTIFSSSSTLQYFLHYSLRSTGFVIMGAATRSEGGVLKLVHTGLYVEIHRSPVIASKIMEENPRHFVTRPDVPWIVVRPESMLMPGKVFHIVPCHTLYLLIREGSRPANHRPPPQQSAMMAVDSGVRVFDERYKPAGAKSCLKKKSCNVSEASLGRRVAFILLDNRMMVVGGGE